MASTDIAAVPEYRPVSGLGAIRFRDPSGEIRAKAAEARRKEKADRDKEALSKGKPVTQVDGVHPALSPIYQSEFTDESKRLSETLSSPFGMSAYRAIQGIPQAPAQTDEERQVRDAGIQITNNLLAKNNDAIQLSKGLYALDEALRNGDIAADDLAPAIRPAFTGEGGGLQRDVVYDERGRSRPEFVAALAFTKRGDYTKFLQDVTKHVADTAVSEVSKDPSVQYIGDGRIQLTQRDGQQINRDIVGDSIRAYLGAQKPGVRAAIYASYGTRDENALVEALRKVVTPELDSRMKTSIVNPPSGGSAQAAQDRIPTQDIDREQATTRVNVKQKQIPASAIAGSGGRRVNAGTAAILKNATITPGITDASGNILSDSQAADLLRSGKPLFVRTIAYGTLVSQSEIERGVFDSLIKSGDPAAIIGGLSNVVGPARARQIADGVLLSRQIEKGGESPLSDAQRRQIDLARDLIRSFAPDEDNATMLRFTVSNSDEPFVASDGASARDLGFPASGGVQQTQIPFDQVRRVRGGAQLEQRIRGLLRQAPSPGPRGGAGSGPSGTGGRGALDDLGLPGR